LQLWKRKKVKAQDPNNKFVSIKEVIATKNSLTKALEPSKATADFVFEDMCLEWSIFDVLIDKSK
jgi:hypothetical protein